MIITISGLPGSGKSTIARMLADKLRFEHYSVGDLMRELAAEKGMSLLELSKAAERDRSIDKELDNKQIALGKNEDNFVIDSRLGFHFIPKSFKVFLKVTPGEAANRIFNARRRVEKENISLEKTEEGIKRREESERLRFERYYNLDPFDEKHYDCVIDTTGLSVHEVADKVMAALKK